MGASCRCGAQTAQDLAITPGAKFEVDLTYTDALEAPVDLTGYRARMQVRVRPGSDLLLDLSTENGRIVLQPNGALGLIHLEVGATATRPVVHEARYDLLLINGVDVDDASLLFSGKFRVIPAVTEL